MVNYGNGKVYKIESHLGDNIYIGSTTKESTLLKGYFSSNYFSDELIKMEEKLKQVNTTLYWNPYFVFYDTPKNEQIIRFFNNHFTKKYLVKIEGVDDKGQVVYFEKIIQ